MSLLQHPRHLLVTVCLCAYIFTCNGDNVEDGLDNMAFSVPGQHDQLKVGVAQQVGEHRRYFLFDVNMGEGFNLRRDVYMRAAQLVKELRKTDESWVMVLPPFRHLYHWQSPGVYQDHVAWSKFFNVDTMNTYIPVIEFSRYLSETRGSSVDQVWYLQGYEGGWKEGTWEEKVDTAKCLDDRGKHEYYRTKDGVWNGPFFGYYDAIHAKEFECVSVQGTSFILKDRLLKSKHQSILIDRFEAVLHPMFGDQDYWLSRKSMAYADHLKKEAEDFMEKNLPKHEEGNTKKGLPYLAVHLRRGDFARSYKGQKGVPGSMKSAAKQIEEALKRLDLNVVYIATDASSKELKELKRLLPTMEHYKPSKRRLNDLLDGGVSIVEQWICANARHFIGTNPSTFTFRINEDRELLGMPVESSFDGLCSDGYKDHKDEDKCDHPTKWTMPKNIRESL